MDRAKNINPDILKWARELAHLSEEEAAARIGLTSTEKASAAEKLRELEDGEKFPDARPASQDPPLSTAGRSSPST